MEILIHIATQSVETFRDMLALPPVARFLKQHRQYILNKFIVVTTGMTFVIYRIGNKLLHRVDGPALEFITGHKEWYQEGKLHREDGPAFEGAKGTKKWFLRSILHRGGDLPAVEYAGGKKEWWQNGKLHREGGPAITYACGDAQWFKNGKLHRDDGPAVECSVRKEWYQHGVHIRTEFS